MIPDLALIVTHCPVQFAQLILVRLLVVLSGPRVSAMPLHDHHWRNKRVVGWPVRARDQTRQQEAHSHTHRRQTGYSGTDRNRVIESEWAKRRDDRRVSGEKMEQELIFPVPLWR